MMQKWWFKIFIWFTASGFFFLSSAILIAYFSPEPSDKAIMSFMSGMMGSMNSTMGISMSLEENVGLQYAILAASNITIPLITFSTLYAILIKVRRKLDE